MKKRNKLVQGVGVNDADYAITGCPFYRRWCSMLQRCYSEKLHERYPTYKDCSVCEEWLTFSNFKSWMEQQDWEGKHLDKDILVEGNKVYSPETCSFVSNIVNNFFNNPHTNSSDLPIGAVWYKTTEKYLSSCRNPFTNKLENLGYYECPQEAHSAWLTRKKELCLELCSTLTDKRVIEALKSKYGITP